MAAMHPSVRDEFGAGLIVVQDAVRAGVISDRTKKADSMWELWLEFCPDHSMDPQFPNDDPVPCLQVFAQRYRDGRIAPSGRAVRSSTVEDAVRHVGQTYRSLGSPDIRLDAHGDIDFRLKRQSQSHQKVDPPPSRVKPIPVQVVNAIVVASYCAQPVDETLRAFADMICLAFFFLLRPGEYTIQKNNTPFRVRDTRLHIGGALLHPRTASVAQLNAVTSCSLIFTTQKNAVKGEIITHGRTGDAFTCPVAALVRRVYYLISRGYSDDTPLCAYQHNSDPTTTKFVNPAGVKEALRGGLIVYGADRVEIKPSEIEARSLRAGGATALLVANVDPNTIQLLGRWKSDAMLKYLHASANPNVQRFARSMFEAGAASFRPGLIVPMHAA